MAKQTQLQKTDDIFRLAAQKATSVSAVDRERFLRFADELRKATPLEQIAKPKAQLELKNGKRVFTGDGFDNFVSRIGLNNDNALSDSMYIFNLMTRNRLQLEAAYRGSWVVGAVVDNVAEDMTREGITITTNESEEDIQDIQSEITRLKLWDSICSELKWARLYGGALGVLQIAGQKLSTPLDISTIKQGQFKGIAVYDRWQLNPLEKIIKSGPDIGLPESYAIVDNLMSTDPEAETMTGQVTVHHSRVIRLIGIELPYFQAITEMMWGESILERLWDRLIAFDNVTMSAASLVDRANLRMVGIENLREILASGGEAVAGLMAQFEMMRLLQVNEGLTLLDKNDEYQTTSYSFAGIPDTILQFGQQLSGASGIPLVRLFGQSPAGLSSTGEADMRMYYDNIKAQQKAKLQTPWGTLLKILWRSVYGKDAPKDLNFYFNPLWQTSDSDKATIAKTQTETIIGAYEAGLTTREASLKELRQASGNTGIFTNITDEDVKDAEGEPVPTPGEVAPANGDEPDETDKPSEELDKPDDPVKNIDEKTKLERVASWLGRKS